MSFYIVTEIKLVDGYLEFHNSNGVKFFKTDEKNLSQKIEQHMENIGFVDNHTVVHEAAKEFLAAHNVHIHLKPLGPKQLLVLLGNEIRRKEDFYLNMMHSAIINGKNIDDLILESYNTLNLLYHKRYMLDNLINHHH